MKRLLLALAIAAASVATFSPAQALDTDVSVLVRKSNVSILEAAAIAVIADAIGLDAAIVIDFGRRSGASVFDFGPAFILGYDCHRKPEDVWKLRRKGKGWGVIAKELGMHPGTFNKMRVNGDFDKGVWVYAMSKRYPVGSKDYIYLQGKGLSHANIVGTIVLAEGRKDRFDSVAASWKKDKSGKSALALHESHKGKGKGPAKDGTPGKSDDKGGGKDQGKGHGGGKGHGKPF